jgi:phosphopantetheinyl transferase
VVTERQAELLLGEGRHPDADRIERELLAEGKSPAQVRRATVLGRPIEHNRSPKTDKAKERTPWLGFDPTFRPAPYSLIMQLFVARCDADYASVLAALPASALARFEFRAQSASALHSALAELLVRKALPEGHFDVEFVRDGKPHAPDLPSFHFNVSHSGELVAAVVDDAPVGVDVQHVGTASPDVGRRYFHPDERRRVGDSRSFHTLWALKESYIKQTGRGLATRLSSFLVTEGLEVLIDGTRQPVHLQTHDLEDHVLAVCATKPITVIPRHVALP